MLPLPVSATLILRTFDFNKGIPAFVDIVWNNEWYTVSYMAL